MKNDTKMTLTVDGLPRNPGNAWVHYQEDPFPGGHRYVLAVSDRLLRKSFRHLANGVHKPVAPELVRELFWSLGIRLDKLREPTRTIVLNAIDQVILSDDGIELEGICSDVVPEFRRR